MVPLQDKTQFNHLAFSRPLLILFQNTEVEKRGKCDAAIEFKLASKFPLNLPEQISLNILDFLLCEVR